MASGPRQVAFEPAQSRLDSDALGLTELLSPSGQRYPQIWGGAQNERIPHTWERVLTQRCGCEAACRRVAHARQWPRLSKYLWDKKWVNSNVPAVGTISRNCPPAPLVALLLERPPAQPSSILRSEPHFSCVIMGE